MITNTQGTSSSAVDINATAGGVDIDGGAITIDGGSVSIEGLTYDPTEQMGRYLPRMVQEHYLGPMQVQQILLD